MKKYILIIFFVFSLILTSVGKGEWGYPPEFSMFPNLGYSWQGINTYEVGARLFTYMHWRHETNFSLFANAIIFEHGATYVAPELTLRYYFAYPDHHSHFWKNGIQILTSYWGYHVLGVRAKFITPEIGIKIFELANISYGYNISLSGTEQSFISSNRITLRLLLK